MRAARIRVASLPTEGFDEAAYRAYCGRLLRAVRETRHREWRQARRRAGLSLRVVGPWSQAGVAQQLGTKKSTVSKVERGERWPFVERLLLYAWVLQVPFDRLFPAQPQSPEALLVREVLAAPPEVHQVIRALLAMQHTPVAVPTSDVG